MSFEIWSWLGRIPDALMFVAAVTVLVRHRRYSRRACNFALMAIAGLVASWLFWIGVTASRLLWRGQLDFESELQASMAASTIGHFWTAACILLLAWAVVIDRRPHQQSSAEADYADNLRDG